MSVELMQECDNSGAERWSREVSMVSCGEDVKSRHELHEHRLSIDEAHLISCLGCCRVVPGGNSASTA